MSNGDELRWMLRGIEAERHELQARLAALDERVRDIQARATAAGVSLSEPPPSDAIGIALDVPLRRRREVSEETRKKLSEKMRARWAEREAKGKKKR